MEVGESLGVSARIHYQSDAKFVDLFSYIQKIIQHTPLSIFPSGIFPSSARMSSFSLEYFPAKSEAKEINLVVKLSPRVMKASKPHWNLSWKRGTWKCEDEYGLPCDHRCLLCQCESSGVMKIVDVDGIEVSSRLAQQT